MHEVIIVLVLIPLGLVLGHYLERKHYKSIARREREYLKSPAVTFRTLPDKRPIAAARLAIGSVVISVDYFKRFLAGVRLFYGGELRSYSPLFDRGKREALLRMKESCPEASLFLNTRLETSSIFKGSRGQSIGSVEIVAYSTAITYADAVHPEGS